MVNIWTEEALAQRPGWGTDFFSGKMKADAGMIGNPIPLEQLLEMLDEAGIDKAFLIAAHSGRPGLPGCYHMPYEVVARACEKYPDRFYGLAGIDPRVHHLDGVAGEIGQPQALQPLAVARTRGDPLLVDPGGDEAGDLVMGRCALPGLCPGEGGLAGEMAEGLHVQDENLSPEAGKVRVTSAV